VLSTIISPKAPHHPRSCIEPPKVTLVSDGMPDGPYHAPNRWRSTVLHLVDCVVTGTNESAFKSWQLAFFAVGIPSIAVAVVFVLTTREPPRASQSARAPLLREVGRYLRNTRRLYLGLFGGAGLLQAVSYSWNAWGPEYIRREFSWPIQHAGWAFGMAGVMATSAGTLLIPAIARRGNSTPVSCFLIEHHNLTLR
jgi:cyanate permease